MKLNMITAIALFVFTPYGAASAQSVPSGEFEIWADSQIDDHMFNAMARVMRHSQNLWNAIAIQATCGKGKEAAELLPQLLKYESVFAATVTDYVKDDLMDENRQKFKDLAALRYKSLLTGWSAGTLALLINLNKENPDLKQQICSAGDKYANQVKEGIIK